MTNGLLRPSRFWLEINANSERYYADLGKALWGPMTGRHKSSLQFFKQSVKMHSGVNIIHYFTYKCHNHSCRFIGESKVSSPTDIMENLSADELKKELEKLVEPNRRGYLKYADALVNRYGKKHKYFLIKLSDYKEFEKPVELGEVKKRFRDFEILQGFYLMPINDAIYKFIVNKALAKTTGEQTIRRRVPEKLLSVTEFKRFLEESYAEFHDNVIERAVVGYNSGKHLLLVGPPGSGKSFLGELLARFLGFEPYRVTASVTWTRYDFIGGPRLTRDGLQWVSGVFFKALARHLELQDEGRGVILVVDELNRCEADRVLAEFFTLYPSNDPSTWRIPEGLIEEIQSYDKIDEPARIVLERLGEEGYRLPWGFRIVATVNSWDVVHLFSLGQALLRRFRVVEVYPPLKENDQVLINKAKSILEGMNISFDATRLSKIVRGVSQIMSILRGGENSGRGLDIGTSYVLEAIISAYMYSEEYRSGGIEKAIDKGVASTIESMLQPSLVKRAFPKTTISALKTLSDQLPEQYAETKAVIKKILEE